MMNSHVRDSSDFGRLRGWLLVGLVCLSALVTYENSWGKMGDCGKPSAGTTPTSTDALVTLQTATKETACLLATCDVDDNGAVTAQDALRILQKASLLPITLTCPDHDEEDFTDCTQSAFDSKITALNQTPSGDHPLLTPFTSVLFDCENTTITLDDTWANRKIKRKRVSIAGDDRNITFALTPRCYDRCLGRCSSGSDCTNNAECASGTCDAKQVCDTGADRLDECLANSDCAGTAECVTAKYCVGGTNADEDCLTGSDCSGGSCTGTRSTLTTAVACSTGCAGYGIGLCSDDPIDACPEIDSGGRRFLQLAANETRVSGLTVQGFFDGITIEGLNGKTVSDAHITNVTFDRQCDDSISNQGGSTSGVGTLVNNTTIKNGCDKCTQDSGENDELDCDVDGETKDWKDDPLSEIPRSCWHVTYDNVTFDGCETPVRFASEGRFLIKNSTMHVDEAATDFECFGPKMGATNLGVRMDGNTIDGCERGVLMEGQNTPEFILENNTIKNCGKRGVVARATAKAMLNRNDIQDNGGTNDNSFPFFGGVALAGQSGDSPQVILGADPQGADCDDDPPPAGCNVLCDNTDKDSDALEVHNARSGYTVNARNNHWCVATSPYEPASSELIGTVTVDDALQNNPLE